MHLMNRIAVNIHQRSEGVHRVDLGERIKEPILLVGG